MSEEEIKKLWRKLQRKRRKNFKDYREKDKLIDEWFNKELKK